MVLYQVWLYSSNSFRFGRLQEFLQCSRVLIFVLSGTYEYNEYKADVIVV